MDTVARLTAYSQQLRQERSGNGAASAQQSPTQHAESAAFATGMTGTQPAAHAAWDAAAVQADAASEQPAAGSPAKQRQHRRADVSSEIQPAPQLPVSWAPPAETPAGATGSRWSTGMAPSPRMNGVYLALLLQSTLFCCTAVCCALILLVAHPA